MTKKEKKQLVELLERVHPFLYHGCSYEDGRLKMIEYEPIKNEIFDIVKQLNPKTKLKKIKIKHTQTMLA